MLGLSLGSARRCVSTALVAGVVAVVGLCATACGPSPSPSSPTSPTPSPVAHPPARIAFVLPESPQRLAEAKQLAIAAVQTLDPGDEAVIARGDFSLVASAVAPGQRLDPSEVASCAGVSVGGPSPRCQAIAVAEQQLARWRAALAQQIAAVQAKPGAAPQDACAADSGWPAEKVLQLLLIFSGEDSGSFLNVLVLGGGDAGARGDAPRLPASYLAHVSVVDAPYTMTCGNPTNLQDWFAPAGSVRLYSAGRPASDFPAFLFQGPPAAVVAQAR